jgi:Family of unknown function (DUF5754)
MKLVKIVSANDGVHKFKAIFDNDGRSRTTKFGAIGYTDYTMSHDKEKRAHYRDRHSKDLKGDATRAGYLSYYVLWGDSTNMATNVASYKKKFSL